MEQASVASVPWEVTEDAAATTSVVEYSRVEAGLADLRERYSNVVFDLTTTAGDKAARAARKELVTTRTTIESIRKEAKAPLLAKAKLLDDEAKRITAEIVALEAPIDEQIKDDEKRREEKRAAREAAERARVDRIRSKMSDIASATAGCASASAEEISAVIRLLESIQITEEDYAEFVDEAEVVRLRAVSQACALRHAAVERESEAARLAAERAEIERQRQELDRASAAEEARIKAERDEIERQRQEIEQAKREAAERERAERERQAAIKRAEDKRLEDERKAQRDAFEADLEAERQKIREQEERQADERAAQEAARRAREKRLFGAAEQMLETLAEIRTGLILVIGDKTPAALLEAVESTLPALRDAAHRAIVAATEEQQ
jgi:IgA-specific serine endopeptidase